jgi:beta-N-acetylhexosaminidase
MAAINERYGVSAAVLKALQAGADNALWITTKEVPAVLDGLEKAVAAGELSMDNINASLQRNSAIKGPVRCGG